MCTSDICKLDLYLTAGAYQMNIPWIVSVERTLVTNDCAHICEYICVHFGSLKLGGRLGGIICHLCFLVSLSFHGFSLDICKTGENLSDF